MKTKIYYLLTVLLIAASLDSCSNETETVNGPSEVEGVDQKVRLVISTTDSNSPTSRAPGDTQPAEGTEANLDDPIRIYVYNDKGFLEYEDENVTLDQDQSTVLTLKTGDKYIYVFGNMVAGKEFGRQTTRKAFEIQELDVTFSNDAPDLSGVTFFMGTLWPEKTPITAGMTDDVEIEIGRIVSKVKLNSVAEQNTSYSNMKGKFINPHYKIASVPTKTFLVGQVDGTPLPPAANHTLVTSAVHEEPPIVTGGAQNPVFTNYVDYKEVIGKVTGQPLENYFYCIENTTKKDAQDLQYYGNTTHIWLRTKYEPTAEEIYDKDLIANGQSLIDPDGTFYTLIHKDQLYITNEAPDDPNIATEYKEYEDGLNYHHFAIKDNEQDDVENRYSVLRNHYYEIDVTGIRDLGDEDDNLVPDEPIPQYEKVNVVVKVIPWWKVGQEEEI